jgi:DNA-binding protein HU-beta
MKSVLINKLEEVVGSKKMAEAAYRALLAEMTETLANGRDITFHGIGKLSVTTRAARKGRNPKTGETMDIPSTKAVKFRAFQPLKKAVNGGGK